MTIFYKLLGFVLIITLPLTSSFAQFMHLTSQTDVDNFDSSITVLSENLNIYDTDDDDPIVDLSNLSNITKFEGFLFLSGLNALDNFDALSNVTSVGGYLWINHNDAISNLDAFSNLTHVGDYLKIRGNEVLKNINGFSNVETVGGYLEISNNNLLSNCCGVQHLLSMSGAIEGDIDVYNNSSECNSEAEIVSWCATPTIDLLSTNIQVFPNPVIDNLYIEHEENELHFTLINADGKELLEGFFQKKDSLDLNQFEKGVYFLKISNGKTSSVLKVLKIA